MNIPYKCKFCAYEGIVTIADDYPKDIINIEAWIPKLCCNRCGQFMEKKRKVLDSIRRACTQLLAVRVTMDEEKARGTETKLRMILEVLTKKFCSLVCDYYHKTNVWDADFANLLMEKPDHWYNVTAHYLRGIATMNR